MDIDEGDQSDWVTSIAGVSGRTLLVQRRLHQEQPSCISEIFAAKAPRWTFRNFLAIVGHGAIVMRYRCRNGAPVFSLAKNV